MKSVYIHIPFCGSICSYCDFSKVLYNENWVNMYLNVLEKEIQENYDGEEVSSIYIGGGTPSSLNMEQLKKLFQILEIFKLSKKVEFTFEMNVDDIDLEKLTFLKASKVNRLSVGVESFDKINLKYLNRKHNKKDIFNAFKLIKEVGFDNINVDLMYALPIEILSILKSDIDNILKLKVNHISAYSLIIENNTVLGNKKVEPLNEDEDYKMYKYLCKKLSKNGYKHYEVSNFCKEGYESIHNKNYWDNEEYYGFGLGAHGYLNGLRYNNTRSLNNYLEGKYRLDEIFLSKKEIMDNEIMLGLRKLEGINIETFFKKFEVNIQDEYDIIPLIKENMLELEGLMLKIPEDKIYIMNSILNKLI